jgi:hypothetical protein
MIPTYAQWIALGLEPEHYIPWTLTRTIDQSRVFAVKSPIRHEKWIVAYPHPSDYKTDVVIGVGLPPQAARDAAQILAGHMDFPLPQW